MKRTSTQAALDNVPYSASSSTDSLILPGGDPAAGSSSDATAAAPRPILRIPKRPRLLGSPFDLSKRLESRCVPGAPRIRRTAHSSDYSLQEDDDEDEHSMLRASDLSSSVGSSMSMSSGGSGGPQRSGLPMGDIFSPRRRGGGVEAPARLSYAGRPRPFNAGWLLSPEDA
ncbi:hypothetical protein TRAPUB_6077 [Trametes pubescens]|uniref:Uncharacterized protein n=1 Tax=Trametes pubescens TaxID=154538 RepID=A0A1M2V6R5_TRAPU|nr:hypothetical protein TRAPUB_6077 [Trametes pubescens]